jgi:lipopolysaccharide/colanic/teichoic acid biosynthesis glycosyltransferase
MMAAAEIQDPAARGQKRRLLLADELYQHYASRPPTGRRGSLRRRLHFVRKKYAWLVLVGGARILKRSLDVTGALVGLVLLSPLFFLVALLIKLTDGGPALFWQTRVGRWGREFPFPKFRSMIVHAERMKENLLKHNQHGESAVTFKIKDDPRITWIGRLIRKGSIDELPQLWCVLKGDMSLVGPRPPLPREVEQYTLAQRRRLDAVPGLTCFWQVQGRSEIPFAQQVQLDVQYIESQSLWLDVKLLFLTVPAVLFGRGAY